MPVCARMLTCTFGGKRTAFQNQFFPSTVGSGDQTLFLICLVISLFIHLYFETGSHETWSLPICLGLLAKELMVLLVSTPPALGLQTRTAVDAWGSNSGSHACATNHFSECDISPVPLPLPFSVLTIEPRASHQGKIAL